MYKDDILKVVCVFACQFSAFASANPSQSTKKPAQPSVAVTKKSTVPTQETLFYSSVDLRHQLNTFYNDKDRTKQAPSLQARLQLGYLMLNKKVDIYATLGVIKQPQTQQVTQRRPRLQIDLFPLRSDYFVLRQYNLVKLPFKDAEENDEVVEGSSEFNKNSFEDGTTYVVGLNPTLSGQIESNGHIYDFGFGTNIWTQLYSKKKYISDIEDDTIDDKLSLTKQENSTSEDQEDYVQRVWSQQSLNVGYQRESFQSFGMSLTGYYSSFYYPEYRIEDGHTNYTYKTDRRSFYRLKAKINLSDNLTLANEFYHFYENFFGNQASDDARRFRNVLRFTYQM